MTNVACFCGCCYSFDGTEEGPCPKCGAVAGVHTAAIRLASHDREQGRQSDAAAAGASRPALLALVLGLGAGQPTS
jgi:hypothetical protein